MRQKSKGVPEVALPEIKKRKENFSEKIDTSKGPESKKQYDLKKPSGLKVGAQHVSHSVRRITVLTVDSFINYLEKFISCSLPH